MNNVNYHSPFLIYRHLSKSCHISYPFSKFGLSLQINRRYWIGQNVLLVFSKIVFAISFFYNYSFQLRNFSIIANPNYHHIFTITLNKSSYQ